MPASEDTSNDTNISDSDEEVSRPEDEFVSPSERIEFIRRQIQLVSTSYSVGDVAYLVSAEWLSNFILSGSDSLQETFGNRDVVDPFKRQLIFPSLDKLIPLPEIAWKTLVRWYSPTGRDGFDYFSLPRKVLQVSPLVFDYSPLTLITKVFTRRSLTISNAVVTLPVNSSGQDFYNSIITTFSLPQDTSYDQIRIWGIDSSPNASAIMKQSTPLAQYPFNSLHSSRYHIELDPAATVGSTDLHKYVFIIVEVKEVDDANSPWPSEQMRPPQPPARRSLTSSSGFELSTTTHALESETQTTQKKEDSEAKPKPSSAFDSDDEMSDSPPSRRPPPPPPRNIIAEPERPYSAYSRSRIQPSYKAPLGTTGLNNLGNTCYMNSALQCLTHIPELIEYFISGYYKREINTDNPIGHDGKIAEAFGELLLHLFGDERSGSSYACRPFRATIGRYNSAFGGYQQQDTQEFLSYLLDGLHEDLNRILKKPPTEKPELKNEDANNPEAIARLAEECWRLHKLRNDSVILDLFVGLYKSTLVCPECNLTSVTFDPFMDLTLPLPSNEFWNKDMFVFPKNGRPIRLSVELDPSANMNHLRKFIANATGVNPKALHFSEIHEMHVYKNVPAGNVNEVISSFDTIYVYEADVSLDDPVKLNSVDSDMEDEEYEEDYPFIVPVYLFVASPDGKRRKAPFPYYITLNRLEAEDPDIIMKKLLQKFAQFSRPDTVDRVIEGMENGLYDWKNVSTLFIPYVGYASKYNKDTPFTGSSTEKKCTFAQRLEEIKTEIPYLVRLQREKELEEEEERREFERSRLPPPHAVNHEGEPPSYDEAVTEESYDAQFTEHSPPHVNHAGYTPIDDNDEEDSDDADVSSTRAETGVESDSSYGDAPDEFAEHSSTRLPANSSSSNLHYADKPTPDDLNDSDHASNFEAESNISNEDRVMPSRGLPGGSGYDEDSDVEPEANQIENSENVEKPLARRFQKRAKNFDVLDFYEAPESESESSFGPQNTEPESNDHPEIRIVDTNGDTPDNELYDTALAPPSPPSHLDDATDIHHVPSRFGPSTNRFGPTSNYGGFSSYPNNYSSYNNNYSSNSRFSNRHRSPDFIRDQEDDPDNRVIVSPRGLIAIEMEAAQYNAIFDESNLQHLFLDVVTPEIIKRRMAREEIRQKGSTLDDCLDQFYKTEVLGEADLWYCSSCKDLKRASKTLELWKTPDIFVVHLKRFSSWREKINDVISFPITGLDMSERIRNTKANSRFSGESSEEVLENERDNELVYDLFAVDNHFGSLHGGHYTAYVKNCADDKWYYFDDSRVTEANPEDSITGNAYLLFYRRRTEGALGGEKMEEVLEMINTARDVEMSSVSSSSGSSSTSSLESKPNLDKTMLKNRFPGVGRTLGNASGSLGSSVISNFGTSVEGTGSEFSSTSELHSFADENSQAASKRGRNVVTGNGSSSSVDSSMFGEGNNSGASSHESDNVQTALPATGGVDDDGVVGDDDSTNISSGPLDESRAPLSTSVYPDVPHDGVAEPEDVELDVEDEECENGTGEGGEELYDDNEEFENIVDRQPASAVSRKIVVSADSSSHMSVDSGVPAVDEDSMDAPHIPAIVVTDSTGHQLTADSEDGKDDAVKKV